MAKKSKKPKPEKKAHGRPSLVNDDARLRALTGALRMGNAFEISCLVADMNPVVIRDYISRARENPDGVHGQWAKAIFRALAQSELADLSVIDRAAQGRPTEFKQIAQTDSKGDPIRDADGNVVMVVQLDGEGRPIILRSEVRPSWQAAAWKLERRAPKRWGRFDRVAIDDMTEFLKDPRNQTEEEKLSAGEIQARANRLVRVKAVLEAVPLDTDLGDV